MSKRRGTGGSGTSGAAVSASPERRQVVYGWEWALDALTSDPERHSRAINIPDTIVRPRTRTGSSGSTAGDWQWLFTRKNGTLSKKKLPVSSSGGRVDRFQLMNKARDRLVQVASRVRAARDLASLSTPPYIAVLYYQDSEQGSSEATSKLLQPAELLEWLQLLQQDDSDTTRTVLGLQAFIPNYYNDNESSSVLYVHWQAPKSSSEAVSVSIERRSGDFKPDEPVKLPLDWPPSVDTSIRQMTDAVVNSLARVLTTGLLSSADFVYVVDDSLKLWLRYIPRLSVTIQAPTTVTTTKAVLPTLLLQPPTADTGTTSKCSGEFCRTPIASLPGLYRLCRRISDDQSKEDEAPLPDTGQRFKLGNNSLLLAHAELSFLHTSIPSDTFEEEEVVLLLQWQEADSVFRAEIGRSQPSQYYKQVLVCTNCHHVYSEINRVRELGFRPRPRSTTTRKPTVLLPPSEADTFDKMFLEELAKQTDPQGPEHDDGASSSRPRGLKTDAAVLPSLSGSLKVSKPSRKPVNSTTTTTAAAATSNNQPTDDGAIAQVRGLEKQLAVAEASLSSAQAQCRRLTTELIQTRTQCAAILKEKDEQHRRQVLERDLELHTNRQSIDTTPSSSEQVARLVETIDALNRQLDDAVASRDAISQQLTMAHRIELKRVYGSHRSELEALRLAEHTAKEQSEALQAQLLTLQAQAQVATTQAKHATTTLNALTTTTLPGLEEKTRRLERQLADALAQNSVVKPTSIASTDEVEAIEKRWRHKVEYLKAQLASEIKCKEELGAHLAQVTTAIEKGKQDKKQALVDQEQAFKTQLERAREAYSKESEATTTLLAQAQAKVVTLQANVTDLVQELTVLKAKEANARLTMDKMAEEQVRLTRQLVDTEAIVEDLQEKTKVVAHGSSTTGAVRSTLAASEETNRVQMEALMRRLDNERQYLKNQLEGEQEERSRSQQQVTELQRELREFQSTAEVMTRELEQKMSAEAAERLRGEQQLHSALQCAEEEKTLLTRQLREVQSKFASAREQALLDRDEVEAARREMAELRAQAAAAADEVQREKQAARAASERMAASIAAVKASLHGVEQDKGVRIQRLEGEVALYLSKLAAAEGDALVREDQWKAERTAMTRETALKLLAMTLRLGEARARLRGVARAFRRLSDRKTRSQVECELSRRHSSHVEAVEEQLSEQMALKCDQLAQTLNDERLAALKAMKEAHDRDREELNAYFEQEKAEIQQELAAKHTIELQTLTSKLEAERRDTAASTKAEARAMEEQRDTAVRDRDAALADVQQWQRTCKQLIEAAKETLEAREGDWQAKEAVLMDVVSQLECRLAMLKEDAAGELVKAVEALSLDHSKAIEGLQADYEGRSKELVARETARLVAEAEARRLELDQQHLQQFEALKTRHSEQLEQELDQVNAQWTRQVADRDESHAVALKAAVERLEARAQHQLDTLQRELTDRKASAVMQCTSKWQRALEEQQERLEADKAAAYQQGVRDREAEWQQAAVQIKAKQKEELDAVQHEAVRAIQAAEERHRIQFQVKLEALTSELEARTAQEVERATVEATERGNRVSMELVASRVEQTRAEMVEKHQAEVQSIRESLKVEFQQHTERQTAAFNEERVALIDQRVRELADLKTELEVHWTRRLADALDIQKAEFQVQTDKLRELLTDESDDARRELEQQLSEQLANALDKQREELVREQEDAIAQVHEDSDKLLEQVERAMSELKEHKERLEKELAGLRAALEEAEDGQFDARETVKAAQQRMAFDRLRLVLLAHKRSHDQVERERALTSKFEAQRVQLELDGAQERAKWRQDAAQAMEVWKQVKEAHDAMLQALTTYKRDELVAHRSSSAVLANEIAIVSRQMDEVAEIQRTLETEVETLQAEAQQVETALRQLALQSSDTALSMAVVAKKRRLNEDFEAVLERLERKKSELGAGDKTLAGLRARKEDKEKELKVLERTLVEILVQQQKQVLKQLAGVQELKLAMTAT